MDVAIIPTLIDQFRETFEGADPTWITDSGPAAAVLGLIDALSPEEAFEPPVPGAKPAAAHVAHLRFALDLTRRRMNGENPPADWKSSFDLPDVSAMGWESMRADLHRAYQSVLEFLQKHRDTPVQELPPINVVGLAAMTAHNAYHLGALRQIVQMVRG